MNVPDIRLQNLLDSLVGSRHAFALYRLPWTDECHLVLQTSDEPVTLDHLEALSGQKGFVIAPFQSSAEHPLVLIRPEVTAFDWPEIEEALTALPEDFFASVPEKSQTQGDITPGKTDTQETGETPVPTQEEDAKAHYQEAFERFIQPLQTGTFQKLVLSRSCTQAVDEDFSPIQVFVRACNAYPRMLIYLCHTPISGTWMGSTPEILLSGHGEEWHTVALAGTMPLPAAEETCPWSAKNQEEQAFVADYIRRTVQAYGQKVDEKGPYTARAGQLIHLKTDFRFRMKDPQRIGPLLNALHPTPAVCGLPKEEAFRFLLDYEGYDRRYYSGFIGWLDTTGTTHLYVNLRCLEIHPHTVTLYAGGGILPLSEPASEWTETENKMQTMRHILQAPSKP